jgi:hypothetical protein
MAKIILPMAISFETNGKAAPTPRSNLRISNHYGSLVARRLRIHFEPTANRQHLMHRPLCWDSFKSIAGPYRWYRL